MEQYKASREKEPTVKGPEKYTLWKRVKAVTEAAAFLALLAIMTTEKGQAQEQPNFSENKDRTEVLKERISGQEKKIIIEAGKNGQPGLCEQTDVKRLIYPSQESVTIGYNEAKEARWLFYENPDASMRFCDVGVDGLVDRVIVNHEQGTLSPKSNSAHNDLKTFVPMSALADEAKITVGLEPENVKVFEIVFENGIVVIRSVDFQSGEAIELSGDEAEQLSNSVQSAFSSALEQPDGDK
ncbi:MAG TPA: hypothetical protein VJB39_03095 [Patescibacteria group bacterium]|nr:hypothetical protein [Patescibacteria group bacterium]